MIDSRSYSWAGKEALWLPRQCSSMHQADFPVRGSFTSPPDVMVVGVWKG